LALNIQTFKTRALTALLFVAVMLTGLLWNSWSFLILFTVIHFGCWFEFVKLMKKIYAEKYLGYCLFGLIYITMPILMIIDLYNPGNHFHIYDTYIILKNGSIPLLIIGSIWINDTMAYLVGSLIGKTPLSKISPKKTIEGTLGGIILCVTVGGLVSHFAFFDSFLVVNLFIMALAAICAIFGTLGDLFESKLKRMADVKDSGNFMPGHGGFLDRFDSLLGAVPFVWLYVKLFV